LKRVTCLPTDSTVPAPSEPGTTGSLMGNGYLPLGMAKSRKLSEAAWTIGTLAMVEMNTFEVQHTLDKNILVANLLNRCVLIVLEGLKVTLAFHRPLFC
jgi:hypothetical protein